jgi:hypothetical protein
MSEKQFRKLIEENLQKLDTKKHTEKMTYSMVFGNIVIQYDFCLN